MSALWNKQKLEKTLKEFDGQVTDCDVAVCIAEDLLRTKPGLKDWITNDLNKPDLVYWLAACMF
jgi:hypothetical protein